MKKHVVYSSIKYLLNVDDLTNLNKSERYYESDEVIIMLGDDKNPKDTLLSGENIIAECKHKNVKYVLCKVAYYSCNPFFAFLIHLFKPIKRKSVLKGYGVYRTTLSYILEHNLTRGVRNRANAYQLKNKKWYIPEEDRIKRYDQLYNSLKKGYNFKYPMLVGLNRHMGFKDQILQGHHRIGICQELKIEEVSISFWAFPKSAIR